MTLTFLLKVYQAFEEGEKPQRVCPWRGRTWCVAQQDLLIQ